MLKIGVAGLVGFLAQSAGAENLCTDRYGANGETRDAAMEGAAIDLLGNDCDSLEKRELRLSLFEFQQEEEDPMTLSVGVKSGGGILRFKIPFSF